MSTDGDQLIKRSSRRLKCLYLRIERDFVLCLSVICVSRVGLLIWYALIFHTLRSRLDLSPATFASYSVGTFTAFVIILILLPLYFFNHWSNILLKSFKLDLTVDLWSWKFLNFPRSSAKFGYYGGKLGFQNWGVIGALDVTVQDGVNVMSLSLGGGPLSDLYTNVIDIGTFKAMQKGTFISCSIGNASPSYTSVSDVAPWYLTVGANTMDKSIRAPVTLGSGESFIGESMFQSKDLKSRPLPIICPSAYGDDNAAKGTDMGMWSAKRTIVSLKKSKKLG